MADHCVTNLDVGHRRTNFLDPTRVLVPEHIWQKRVIRILYRLPLALDDVDVRATEPRRTDTYDHIERTFDFRLVYLLDLEAVFGDAVVVTVQPCCYHEIASSGVP